MKKLRKVGSEFEHQFPPSMNSTDNSASVFTYRVVAHDSAYIENGRIGLIERIQPISMRKRPFLGLSFHTDDAGSYTRPVLGGDPPKADASEYVEVEDDREPTEEERNAMWSAIDKFNAMA